MADYNDLTRVLQERIASWEGKATSGDLGFVVQVGDTVATVYGLDKAIYGELLNLPPARRESPLTLRKDASAAFCFPANCW